MKRRSRRGFTIIELMVSLTVGGIAISSVYAIGAASTRHMREQQRVSTTQSSLRVAMNQIKRDFQRAGYMGTPNIQRGGETCGSDPGSPLNSTGAVIGQGRLAAISAYFKNVARPTNLDPSNLNGLWATVDDVTLMGNYSTSGEYRGVQLNSARNGLTLPITSQSFARDFTNWYAAGGRAPGSCDQVALQAAFPPGRLLRVHGRNDLNAYVVSAGASCVAAGPAVINLASALATNCTNVDAGWVSPLNTIRYTVVNASVAEDSRTNPGTVAVLRRIEVDPANKATALAVSGVSLDDRAVLDYVVHFSVDFLMTNGANQVTTLNYAAESVANVQAQPERVRGAIVELAARTAEHEPQMTMQLSQRLPPFRLTDTAGGARVRALRAELLLPNIALKNM